MRKVMNIIKGWLKSFGIISVSGEEQRLSVIRMKICGRCEFSKASAVLEFVNGDLMNEMQLVCTKCGCPCLQKSLVVEESCPIGEW